MTLLVLIPARGGSKRVPRKNVRLLGGRPLIQWTIDLALRLPATEVVVSTDDGEIADVSRAAGVLVPDLRPNHLASDSATSLDVALYELEKYESANGSVDGLILLQPTSPFRQFSTVVRGIELFQNKRRALVGMSPARVHPALCFKVEGDRIVKYPSLEVPTRSQDLSPAFQINGGLYIISPTQLRAERTFFPIDASPVVTVSEVEALDIDTEWDWLCAEQAVNAGLVG